MPGARQSHKIDNMLRHICTYYFILLRKMLPKTFCQKFLPKELDWIDWNWIWSKKWNKARLISQICAEIVTDTLNRVCISVPTKTYKSPSFQAYVDLAPTDNSTLPITNKNVTLFYLLTTHFRRRYWLHSYLNIRNAASWRAWKGVKNFNVNSIPCVRGSIGLYSPLISQGLRKHCCKSTSMSNAASNRAKQFQQSEIEPWKKTRQQCKQKIIENIPQCTKMQFFTMYANCVHTERTPFFYERSRIFPAYCWNFFQANASHYKVWCIVFNFLFLHCHLQGIFHLTASFSLLVSRIFSSLFICMLTFSKPFL